MNKLIDKIYYKLAKRRSDWFCRYLRAKGVQVGGGNHFDSWSSTIDLTRPSLITIGNNCYFNENFTLMTHDFVAHVFQNMGLDYLNSSGRVVIGDNVSFGRDVTVLKGVTIGDNVFIGAGSIVTKDIPSNCLAVGAPCKPIITIEAYYEKRKKLCVEEALVYARSIKERYGRLPLVEEFREEFPLFVDGSDGKHSI